MIPYDDLVAALANWRARQGLPVAQMAELAPVEAVSHATPPPPPPRASPPPLAPVDTRDEDVDESALLETHYENEGDDFAMSFAAEEVEAESTSIGSAPPPGARDSFGGGGTEPEPEPLPHEPMPHDPNNRNDDW